MRRAVILASALLALVLASEASAEEVVLADKEGRSIRFDVRAAGVDVEWYAALLRDAPHAGEIENVRVHIVGPEELAVTCGRQAAGCYDSRIVTVPARETGANAHTLVHEYGHHIDASQTVPGAREPNGSRTWWRARGIDRLLELRLVYRGYVRGWDRNIAEIFAEDYARLAQPGAPHKIPWLHGPNAAVLAAIRHDLGLGPEPTITAPPLLKPVAYTRSGTLVAKHSSAVPFGLLGPGRRVRATATVAGAAASGVRARLELRCEGRRIATRTVAEGQRTVTLDRDDLGPAESCFVTLTNSGTAARTYTLRVRLLVTI